jgi:hypothetical protein
MKILSIRRGFASDHSSTSYEFLAVDKPLGKKERAEVSKLSSRVNPTSRRANFVYHIEGYDIPGGWEKLMAQYYDVMYCEDYDWWTLAIAFNAAPGQFEQLRAYEFEGTEEENTGISIEGNEQRAIVTIYCLIEAFDESDEYYGEDEDEDSEGGDLVVTENELLNVLAEIRQQIMDGDYRALYAVWEKYGDEEDENPPPEPESRKTGEKTVSAFKNMLGYLN